MFIALIETVSPDVQEHQPWQFGQEIAEWNCTELSETLNDMIDNYYKQHCECVAKFIEECGDISSGPDADDFIPF